MREFICKHPIDGNFLLIRTGVKGYINYPCTQERADQINVVNGNTGIDCENALMCSMFGWDTPAAGRISKAKAQG